MKNKLLFYLSKVPLIGISIFIIFNIIAISQYPGYDMCYFFEGDDCKSSSYSFKYNFFSNLGSINTNTDDDIYEFGENNQSNILSMLFFNASLIAVGTILILFYRYFNMFFLWKHDSERSINYSLACKYIGIVTGIMFAGVGLAPHDLHFGLHVFFANGAFLTLLPLSIFHTLAFRHSRYIKSIYSFGYIIFCLALLSYLYLIFYGPRIEPGGTFTQFDLMLQVVGQKSIILIFAISILYQSVGLKRELNNS